jgi:hypothetical protein
MDWFARIALVSLVAIASAGCGESSQTPLEVDVTQPTRPDRPPLVRAPRALLVKCGATARAVGYPVPCPTRVPAGLVASGGRSGCRLDVIGPGGQGDCAKEWRGWVVGSSETRDQHLVITASPNPVASGAKLVNGPAWYRAARVRPLARLTIDDWRMRAVYAPRRTNDGSAFADHVVLIWTVGRHTYGIGFHNYRGIPATLRLNEALARGIELIEP